MKQLNLSDWSLRHQAFVAYLLGVVMLAGTMAYFNLGRAEDPDFTIKTMIVSAEWPGATAREMELQVTDRLEKKLQETPWLDFVQSYSEPGHCLIFVNLKDYAPNSAVPDAWYQVHKKLNDIAHTLPDGVRGPFFNDEFGDTYGTIYAFTADGFTHAELKDAVDDVRQELLRIPNVAKVDLIGVQQEKIYVEISHRKLANLGIDPMIMVQSLRQQNDMSPAGSIDTASDKIYLRVSGDLKSVDAIREIGIEANGRQFRLGDIAKVYRGYSEPMTPKFRYRGEDAIGLAVSMTKGGDILALGEKLSAEIGRLSANLPVGIDVHQVSDQPRVVRHSVDEFMKSLGEAVVIVLAVSFLSLGWRTGLVVALSIPLVLAITFLVMKLFGIDLQRISLGALIISLGLLVDDAIISVEMMVVKMEQGWDRVKAATFAYTSTAFPMLTGTLVTVAAFTPVGFAKSSAGEYCFTIFAVVGISLLASWLVAVIFTPYIGYLILPDIKGQGVHGEAEVYNSGIYPRFRRLIAGCLQHRRWVLTATALLFVLAMASFRLIEQQFFPFSDRPEVLVDLWLPQGASILATEQETHKAEALLKDDPDVVNYVSYVGSGSLRFYLPLDQQQEHNNFAQIVVLTKDLQARERLLARLRTAFDNDFTRLRVRLNRLENGPPVGFPVQFRVSGRDIARTRQIAEEVAKVMRNNPHTQDVQLDWGEPSKAVHLEVDQDKARVLGVSSRDISFVLNTMLSGLGITDYRENNKLIKVLGRSEPSERNNPALIEEINIHTRNGKAVPLSQLVHSEYGFEEGIIWRRDRFPTFTVRSDIRDNTQAPVVAAQIEPLLEPLRTKLPDGYRIEVGGAVESSQKAQASINAVMPVMLFGLVTLLMMQLQSLKRTAMVLLTAPLGMIGVAAFLLLFHIPFGFVATLGVIALAGMIMRNSVILVDQIDQDIAAGVRPWDAIIEAAVRRLRPILLTAAAAILAMIPLTGSVFWGPMAVAIMGGLLVATLLTPLFVSALYAAWFGIREE
ncbi:efflux RND transporter permease subunit [Candidatus Methylobacter oryzae]|uniref:Efflux RND transporter permease subunit n=1 Tax=Candidatus Methylobacter oryzae TaxID=2497749 RepID=A0ABY3CB12_9GAMM|nr:efflux RND transporter permease subunit [Candidatus Methylobacter oryzae]TRW95879.1 efflux RND transporter permease subunit [Candidatus Methylobacter oryzae]